MTERLRILAKRAAYDHSERQGEKKPAEESEYDNHFNHPFFLAWEKQRHPKR